MRENNFTLKNLLDFQKANRRWENEFIWIEKCCGCGGVSEGFLINYKTELTKIDYNLCFFCKNCLKDKSKYLK